MTVTQVHVSDATLTLIGHSPDDPPVVTEDELHSLRELWRLKDDQGTMPNVLLTAAMLERIIESIAIGISHIRHSA
jgi:hypothetical protein